MHSIAWVVVGEQHYQAVHGDYTLAMQDAVKHHGVVRDLVLADEMHDAVRAAFEAGRRAAQMDKEQSR
jgi:hypothetical protein